MITKKICPNCGSDDVTMVAGGITGNWMCKRCGYQGSVLEKEIVGKEMKILKSDTKMKGETKATNKKTKERRISNG